MITYLEIAKKTWKAKEWERDQGYVKKFIIGQRKVMGIQTIDCLSRESSSVLGHVISMLYYDVQACNQHEPVGCSQDGETVQRIQEVGGFRSCVNCICQL